MKKEKKKKNEAEEEKMKEKKKKDEAEEEKKMKKEKKKKDEAEEEKKMKRRRRRRRRRTRGKRRRIIKEISRIYRLRGLPKVEAKPSLIPVVLMKHSSMICVSDPGGRDESDLGHAAGRRWGIGSRSLNHRSVAAHTAVDTTAIAGRRLDAERGNPHLSTGV
ncbi:hypothetical protein EYF80_025599 [Liparis tanakae]|uniref:Uncharacterized protein n=1 Tax=Liparis tanakae TaxID=230148 RepID=A0A4Z2HEQ3_9TELE|nr:hypothetical protein EYF80_025599 [Liparis tanakae]